MRLIGLRTAALCFAFVATIHVGAANPVIVPLVQSATVADLKQPEYPKKAVRQRREATVVANVWINELGGVTNYSIDDGPDKDFVAAARDALFTSRFTSPQAAKTWVHANSVYAGCAAWVQWARLTYKFALEGLTPRVLVWTEFADNGFVPELQRAEIDEWFKANSAPAAIGNPGFVDLKPIERGSPQFNRQANITLSRSTAFHPQIEYAMLLVGTDGVVQSLLVTKSPHDAFLLKSDVRKAVSAWRFAPATLDGKPVPRSACQRFEFKLE